MKLRNKKTGESGELHYYPDKAYHFAVSAKDQTQTGIYKTLGDLLQDWTDFIVHETTATQIADEMDREIIKKWYNKNKIVGDLRSYGGECWLGLEGRDKNGCYWKIELCVSYNSMLKDDEFYSLTELIGEEE